MVVCIVFKMINDNTEKNIVPQTNDSELAQKVETQS